MKNDSVEGSGDDASPDRDERVQDFLGRHGGAGTRPVLEERSEGGLRGRYEVFAADGYRLRCDWSRTGSREELSFSEIPPTPA